MLVPNDHLLNLIRRCKADRESVCNTWFIDNETRLTAFRSIRHARHGTGGCCTGPVMISRGEVTFT